MQLCVVAMAFLAGRRGIGYSWPRSSAGRGDGGMNAEESGLAADAASRLVALARALHSELHPRRGPIRAGLDSSLDRDWGFDSLSRAELLLRVERAFSVHLPETLLGKAETLADLLAALGGEPAPSRAEGGRATSLGGAAEPAPSALSTLTAVLDWHAAHQGDRLHLVHRHGDGGETSLTYHALAERGRSLARGLRQAGLQPGDRAAIMLATGEDFFAAFFGVLYAGGVPVPIYPPARPSQLEEHMRRQAGILRNAGAALLIAPEEAKPLARLLRLQVESLAAVVTVAGLEGAAGALPQHRPPEAAALIQYTSGSTGDPKGVVLSHSNLLANIRAMGQAMAATPADIFVSWLPLYHDMGLIGAWLGSLHFAVPLVVMSPVTFLVRPEQWLWAIHHHRATLTAAPNFAFELCLRRVEDAAITGLDLSSLRMVANGAEPVAPSTIRRFAERFAAYGFRPEAMAPVYGLAECAVGLAFPPLGRRPVIDRVERAALARDGLARPAGPEAKDAVELVACGRPLPGHEIRIVDPSGELGERQEGRLQFRGPSATAGYFDNPAATSGLIENGWLNSGDLAYIARGDVFITGRSKDIIIRAGRHVHPAEIEAAVGEVYGVRRGCVAVFGVGDASSGTEKVVVLAETRETDPSARAALRQRVAEAAAPLLEAPPEEVVLVPPRSVPKTSSGKLRRAAARERFIAGRLTQRPRAVWRQLADLALAAVAPQLRRLARRLAALGYAGWWWSVVAALGGVLWLGVVLLPRRAWRWALLRGTARLAFRLMAIRHEVSGRWALGARGIVVVNHASYLDGLALAPALPGEPALVVKNELERQFFAGLFLKALGALFVERADPAAGVEDVAALLPAAAERVLVFFPEGTFTRAPGLLPFRLGGFLVAARQSLPVLPVTLRGTRSILRGEQWFPRHGALAVQIGPPIAPEGTDFAAALRLRDRTRGVILAACREPDLAEG